MKICLLGASFETGNLGVSALAESSVKLMLNRWPDLEVVLWGSGYEPRCQALFLKGRQIPIRVVPVRFCKNIRLPYHFLWFLFYSCQTKLLPRSRLKERLVNRNPYFKELYQSALVLDITAGDSFSDIYGLKRYALGLLQKWIIFFLGKKLILLPQTYGPFRRHIARVMARYVLNHASLVYCRDQRGVEHAKKILNHHCQNAKIKFVPDIAFSLDPRKPDNISGDFLSRISDPGRTVVGFNISGLLFNGGYTQDNMFGLIADYRNLVYAIIDLLMQRNNVIVVLIPHVLPPAGFEVESDFLASQQVYERYKEKYADRLFLIEGRFNHSEMKYIIGLCNFFIGSRMHSCIAAMSQNVPSVGLAYSPKFDGVFEAVGVVENVIDLRRTSQREVLDSLARAFDRRETTGAHLEQATPRIQQRILNMLTEAQHLID